MTESSSDQAAIMIVGANAASEIVAANRIQIIIRTMILKHAKELTKHQPQYKQVKNRYTCVNEGNKREQELAQARIDVLEEVITSIDKLIDQHRKAVEDALKVVQKQQNKKTG